MNALVRKSFVLALAVTACLAGQLAIAQEEADDPLAEAIETSTDAERLARGKMSYRIYCQNCHGVEARGDGPIAHVLKVEPPDLTRLAADNDGDFPRYRVYRVIDGRELVRAHGNREMPVWGMSFQELGRDIDQEAEVQVRILDLVSYLESIQEAGS